MSRSASPSPPRRGIEELAAERVLQLLRAPQAGPVVGSLDGGPVTSPVRRGPGPGSPAAGRPTGSWVPGPPPGARPPGRTAAAPEDPGGPAPRQMHPSGRTDRGRHRAPTARVFTVPFGFRAARWHPRAAAVLAVLAVAVLAAGWFAVRVAAASRAAEPTAVPARTGIISRGAAAILASSSGTEPAASGSVGGRIIVHVVGEIARPGVVVVSPGARVIDAITAAGGAVAGADLERINLARVVADGEQVHVPAPGESILPGAFGSTLRGPDQPPASGVSGSAQRVNLNTADLAALDSLPGVGPVLAQRILDWRRAHGRFTAVEELGEVSGIGERLLAQLTDRVTV